MLTKKKMEVKLDKMVEGKKDKLVIGFNNLKTFLDLLEYTVENDFNIEIRGAKVIITLLK